VCSPSREDLREEALTLSKPALMSEKRVETLSLGFCRVLTSCARETQASEVPRPGREPHWLGWRMPLERAMAESLTVITCSRIFDTVLRRTIIRNDTRESYEPFPSLSRITPFTFFCEGRWYPKAIGDERSSKTILELIRLTLFHTKYGMPSGPGAE